MEREDERRIERIRIAGVPFKSIDKIAVLEDERLPLETIDQIYMHALVRAMRKYYGMREKQADFPELQIQV